MISRLSFSTFLLVGYTLIAMVFLSDYWVFDAALVVGLAVFPFSLQSVGEPSSRYIFAFILLLIACFLMPSYTLFYLSIITGFIFVFETYKGKLSLIPILLLVTISPLFRYITDVFSFDLRLVITDMSVKILRKAPLEGASDIKAMGNIIRLPDQTEWLIDTACMGLNMMAISLILTFFFIAYFQKKSYKISTNQGILCFTMGALSLTLLSNLMRIVVVVSLKILPHTSAHEMIGVLSLIVYTLIPLYFIIQKCTQYRFFFKEKTVHLHVKKENFTHKSFVINKNAVHLIFFLLVFGRGFYINFYKKPEPNAVPMMVERNGFETTYLKDGVYQLKNDSVLIYVKNLPYFFTTEHSPMICWKGSGYVFKQIEKTNINGIFIYTGILEKENTQIYTSWWFQSGEFATTDPLLWRYRMCSEGISFHLVNISAANRETMLKETEKWLMDMSAFMLM